MFIYKREIAEEAQQSIRGHQPRPCSQPQEMSKYFYAPQVAEWRA
jgi:hypothetical protein